MLATGFFIFITALLLAIYFLQKIIYISHEKHLFDEPSETRKIHITKTPNLGGVAIFTSMMFASCIILSLTSISYIPYIIFCSLILFLTGLTDDLVGMDPLKKFGSQLFIAVVITIFTNLRITSFYGLFGIYEIPFMISVPVSVVFIIYLVNAFNLIDGINCLAAGIGLLACSVLSIYFWKMNDPGFTFLSLGMCGCLVSFIFYNRTPAKIFMGDTGSLFLGFFIAILSIHFLEACKLNFAKPGMAFSKHAPILIFSLIVIPIYDTLRVFTIRVANGKSPFVADRNHIHHQLLNLNFSHLQATGILLSMNVIFIFLGLLLQNFRIEIFFLSVTSLIVVMNWILSIMNARQAKERRLQNSTARPKLTIVREYYDVVKHD